ncbi:MAG: hypothetical protein HY721_28745 [Planctomycetes bacterium]|nr:hypothetical protein [Planctomycetota bacterium]
MQTSSSSFGVLADKLEGTEGAATPEICLALLRALRDALAAWAEQLMLRARIVSHASRSEIEALCRGDPNPELAEVMESTRRHFAALPKALRIGQGILEKARSLKLEDIDLGPLVTRSIQEEVTSVCRDATKALSEMGEVCEEIRLGLEAVRRIPSATQVLGLADAQAGEIADDDALKDLVVLQKVGEKCLELAAGLPRRRPEGVSTSGPESHDPAGANFGPSGVLECIASLKTSAQGRTATAREPEPPTAQDRTLLRSALNRWSRFRANVPCGLGKLVSPLTVERGSIRVFKVQNLFGLRKLKWVEKPYDGHALDPPAAVPGLWELPVHPPEKFVAAKESPFRLRGTERVSGCTSCRGQGRTTCGSCDGKGETRCASCGGRGDTEVLRMSSSGSGFRKDSERCSPCMGTGFKTCSRCGRTGYLQCYRCDGWGKVVEHLVCTTSYKPAIVTKVLCHPLLPKEKATRAARQTDIQATLLDPAEPGKFKRESYEKIRDFAIDNSCLSVFVEALEAGLATVEGFYKKHDSGEEPCVVRSQVEGLSGPVLKFQCRVGGDRREKEEEKEFSVFLYGEDFKVHAIGYPRSWTWKHLAYLGLLSVGLCLVASLSSAFLSAPGFDQPSWVVPPSVPSTAQAPPDIEAAGTLPAAVAADGEADAAEEKNLKVEPVITQERLPREAAGGGHPAAHGGQVAPEAGSLAGGTVAPELETGGLGSQVVSLPPPSGDLEARRRGAKKSLDALASLRSDLGLESFPALETLAVELAEADGNSSRGELEKAADGYGDIESTGDRIFRSLERLQEGRQDALAVLAKAQDAAWKIGAAGMPAILKARASLERARKAASGGRLAEAQREYESTAGAMRLIEGLLEKVDKARSEALKSKDDFQACYGSDAPLSSEAFKRAHAILDGGNEALAAGRLDDAEKAFFATRQAFSDLLRECRHLREEKARTHVRLGSEFLRRMNLSEADLEFGRGLEILPGFREAEEGRAQVAQALRAVRERRLKGFDAALSKAESLIKSRDYRGASREIRATLEGEAEYLLPRFVEIRGHVSRLCHALASSQASKYEAQALARLAEEAYRRALRDCRDPGLAQVIKAGIAETVLFQAAIGVAGKQGEARKIHLGVWEP